MNGVEAKVLITRTADPPFEIYNFGGIYSFLSIDADEPVTLKITEKRGSRSLEHLTIRPASLNLSPRVTGDHTFEVTVDHPCFFSIEPNGRERPLLVFVNPLEKDIPEKDDPDVIWFGPGIHRPEGGKITLTDNQTFISRRGRSFKRGF